VVSSASSSIAPNCHIYAFTLQCVGPRTAKHYPAVASPRFASQDIAFENVVISPQRYQYDDC
jgi:hypothetical protein